jgi:hypothetical protein
MVSFRIFDTPVKVKFTVLIPMVALWIGITWIFNFRYPERDFWQCVLIGFVSVVLLLIADFGHAIAHIFSARYANAPMDEISIIGDMPRTLYWNNNVSPSVHRMRAMGGPIFSTLGLILSLAVYGVVSGNDIVRELAVISAVGHGFILIGSLLPLPMVDGGTILKWTIVASGKTELAADKIVQRVNLVIGILGVIIGVGLLAMQLWIPGVVLLGIGIVCIFISIKFAK